MHELHDLCELFPRLGSAEFDALREDIKANGLREPIVLHEGSAVTQDELQEFVKTYLRSSRTPEHFEFKAELPYNETGKLLRRVIREDLAHLGDGSTL